MVAVNSWKITAITDDNNLKIYAMPEMQLITFARISHGIQEFDFKNINNIKSELDKISDKYLSDYDCGMFIFQKLN